MPDEFNYTLGLNPQPFVEGTKVAAAADKQLGETIKSTAKDATAAQKDLTAAVVESGKAAQQAQAQAATTTKGSQDTGIKDWIADIKAQGTEAAKTKMEVEDLGKAGAKAGDGFSKMGRDVGAMKGMLRGGMFAAVSSELMSLGQDLMETHPKLGAVADGIGTIGAVAGQGAMIAGPWGAAIGGALGTIKVAYDALAGPSQQQIENDKAAALASKALADSIERKAKRMKEAAEATREYTKELADNLRAMQASNSAAANRGLDFNSAMADASLDARRAAAGGLEGRAGVEANRQIDKDAVDQKFKDKEAALRSDYDQKRDPLDRLKREREEARRSHDMLPARDEEGRAKAKEWIKGLTEEIDKMKPSVEAAKQALEGFQSTKDRLIQAEKKTIDTRSDVAGKKADEKAEDEKFKAHDKARKEAVDEANKKSDAAEKAKKAEAEKMGKLKDEADRRGIDTSKGGWAFKLRDSIVKPPPAAGDDDDDDEDSPRAGRGGAVAARRATFGRRILGVGSKNNKAGQRLSEETRDPRIAAKGKPGPETQISKEGQAILKVLSDIYRETRKNNNNPKK